MSRLPLSLLALLPLLLVACGEDEPGTPVKTPAGAGMKDPASTSVPLREVHPAPSTKTPEALVALWLESAGKKDEAALYDLGTEEWRAKEKADPKALTGRIVRGETSVESLRIFPGIGEGDSVTVSTRVRLRTAGTTSEERKLHFDVIERGDRWWIVDVR